VRDTALLMDPVREIGPFRNESVRFKNLGLVPFRVSVAPTDRKDSIRTHDVIVLAADVCGKFVAKRTLSEELIHNIEELVERYAIPPGSQCDEGFGDNFIVLMQIHAVHLPANVIHRYVAGGQLVHVFEGISQYRAAKSAAISRCTDSYGASQPTSGTIISDNPSKLGMLSYSGIMSVHRFVSGPTCAQGKHSNLRSVSWPASITADSFPYRCMKVPTYSMLSIFGTFSPTSDALCACLLVCFLFSFCEGNIRFSGGILRHHS